MNLKHLGHCELRYTALRFLDYGAGGQIYGTLDGSITGDKLQGDLQLTNLATKRPDDVNLPALRGLLRTHDGAEAFVVIEGMALARPSDGARVISATFGFRTGDPRYAWLNAVFAVAEGILDKVAVGGLVHLDVYECEPTIQQPG